MAASDEADNIIIPTISTVPLIQAVESIPSFARVPAAIVEGQSLGRRRQCLERHNFYTPPMPGRGEGYYYASTQDHDLSQEPAQTYFHTDMAGPSSMPAHSSSSMHTHSPMHPNSPNLCFTPLAYHPTANTPGAPNPMIEQIQNTQYTLLDTLVWVLT